MSKPVSTSPLSGSNFDPFATHPFTSYSPPAPRAPVPARNPAPTHSHNTTQAPPKRSPSSPTAPIFVPYRPEASPPELSQVLKKQPAGRRFRPLVARNGAFPSGFVLRSRPSDTQRVPAHRDLVQMEQSVLPSYPLPPSIIRCSVLSARYEVAVPAKAGFLLSFLPRSNDPYTAAYVASSAHGQDKIEVPVRRVEDPADVKQHTPSASGPGKVAFFHTPSIKLIALLGTSWRVRMAAINGLAPPWYLTACQKRGTMALLVMAGKEEKRGTSGMVTAFRS
ncbi:hypothetical protein DFH09DRAFT_1273640 [Mycena vulgaris]|nr:hypothetical protein DFH09DRAFT_1273640 [Mycena vulgaris]